MTNEEFQAVEMMLERGGSFVRAMARAYQYADTSNRETLRNAFPEYFESYAEMYRMKVEKETASEQ